jgi:hypothetical protein
MQGFERLMLDSIKQLALLTSQLSSQLASLDSRLSSMQKEQGIMGRKVSMLLEERARQAASRELGERYVPGLLVRSPTDLLVLLPEQALVDQYALAQRLLAPLVSSGVALELLRNICRALQVRGTRLLLPAAGATSAPADDA